MAHAAFRRVPYDHYSCRAEVGGSRQIGPSQRHRTCTVPRPRWLEPLAEAILHSAYHGVSPYRDRLGPGLLVKSSVSHRARARSGRVRAAPQCVGCFIVSFRGKEFLIALRLHVLGVFLSTARQGAVALLFCSRRDWLRLREVECGRR